MELFIFVIITYIIGSLSCYFFCVSEINLLLRCKEDCAEAFEFYNNLKKYSFIPICNIFLLIAILSIFIAQWIKRIK